MLRITIITLLVGLAVAGQIDIQECDEKPVGTDIELTVEGVADGTSTITLQKGQEYNLCISFTAGSDSQILENELFGEIAGIPVPWGGVEKDACLSLTEGSCPLKSGTRYTYCNSLKVMDSYPAVSLVIIWNQNGDNDKQVCFRLPAKITN